MVGARENAVDRTCFMLDRMIHELRGRLDMELARGHPDLFLINDWQANLMDLRHDHGILRGPATEERKRVVEKYAAVLRLRCSPVLRTHR